MDGLRKTMDTNESYDCIAIPFIYSIKYVVHCLMASNKEHVIIHDQCQVRVIVAGKQCGERGLHKDLLGVHIEPTPSLTRDFFFSALLSHHARRRAKQHCKGT